MASTREAPDTAEPRVKRRRRAMAENAISASKPRGSSKNRVRLQIPLPQAVAEPPMPQSPREIKRDIDLSTIPEDVQRRFTQLGRRYHFQDGTRAFTDRGKRLTSPSENTEVIRSLIAVAEARGWQRITVTGTERFRKEAWFSARLAGLEVRGYTPSALEQEHLVRSVARRASLQSDAKGSSEEGVRERSDEALTRRSEPDPAQTLLTGKLIEHGRAPYRHDPKQPMSYYVRLENERGTREIWGVDLERALKQSASRPQPGDDVGLRSLGRQPVSIKSGESTLQKHRNRWSVETLEFIHERAALSNVVRDTTIEPTRAVRSQPALLGTYMALKAAELASKQFRDPQDRERFIEIVRASLADSMERGEPMHAMRMRERPPKAADRPERAPDRDQALARG